MTGKRTITFNNTPTETKKEQVVLIISYIPLLRPPKEPGNDYSVDELQEIINEQTDENVGFGEGCLWACDDNGSMAPVMIMQKAKEIYDHIIEWAEGDTRDYFHMHIIERDNKYVIALMADIEKSIERWEVSRLAFQGEILNNVTYRVITHPLRLKSEGDVYFEINDKIPNPCYMGLVDYDEIDMQDPLSADMANIMWLGPFSIKNNDDYCRQFLEDCVD